MRDPRLILLAVFVLDGLLFVALSLPLILGKVGPNPWYGFRVGRTLKDPAVWYAVNRYAAWRMLAVAAVLVLVAPALYFTPGVSLLAYALACVAVLAVGIAVMVIQTLRYLWRLG